MTKRTYFLSIAASLLATTAIAQDLPQAEALTGLVASKTPPFWSVKDLEVVATSRAGDAVRPQAQIRFEAVATPDLPLFAEASREGPFILVIPTEAEGAARRLYGYLDLAYAAGKWDGNVVIENPVDAFGQPRDMFPAPTLVLGTKEAETRLGALQNNDIAGAAARHEAALADRESAHQRALTALQAEQSKAVSQARARQIEELAAVTDAAEEAIAKARTDGQARLAELQAEYETRLSQLTTEKEPLVAAAAAERAKILAEEQARTDAEMDKLRAEHAERRGKLIEAQRQELAELETQLATERVSLQRQLETAQDTITLQQALLSAMEKRAAGAEQVLAAFKEASETRRTFYARLPKEWTGQVVCRTDDKSYDATWPISLWFEQATTTGFTGLISPNNDIRNQSSRDTRMSVTTSDDTLSLPLTMRVQSSPTGGTNGEIIRFLGDYDVTMQPDGLMSASFQRPINVDNVRKVATCNMRLGVRES